MFVLTEAGRDRLDQAYDDLALEALRSTFFPCARFDSEGVESIPRHGPVILVGNHRSYFDTMAISMVVARTGRAVRFLGKKELFDAPVIGQVATAMGGIRVDRGTGSDEPLHAAADHIQMRLDENCPDAVLERIERLAGELNLDLLDLQDGTVYPPPIKTR